MAGPLRTQVAQQAMAMSDLLNTALAKKTVGADPPRRLFVQEPDGPSTEGGKRARQSIALVPASATAQGGSMCGWIDTSKKVAELRTYRVVAKLHQDRYHRPFDVTKEQYDDVIGELGRLLSRVSVQIRWVEDAGELARASVVSPAVGDEPSEASGRSGASWGVAIVVLVLALAGAFAYVALR